jgi:prolyl oligopeptidase
MPHRRAPGEWKLALDVGALRATEAKPYELHWSNAQSLCLATAFDRCLLMLSPGGGDQVELREFDLLHPSLPKGSPVMPSFSFSRWSHGVSDALQRPE